MQDYINADQHLHQLCQIIAKASRTYVPKKEDDSHTNLYYDALGDRIIGRPIVSPNFGQVNLAFNLLEQNFEWLDISYKPIESVDPIAKNIVDVEDELSTTIEKLGLNTNGFSDKLHFEIPNYSFANDKIAQISVNSLDSWKYYRKLANDSCSWLLGHLQKEEEIRIWPHHFDTGFYVILNEKMGIGFGLAMKDDMAGDSYFYIAGYPLQEAIVYNDMPALENGRWEIGEHWSGAVLTLSEIKKSEDIVTTFLQETIKWYLNY